MEMQIYAMDACFQIGQGGRKESDGPKGWNKGYFFGLVFGSKGLEMNAPIISKHECISFD